jgi:PAB1-binding protein PBP1
MYTTKLDRSGKDFREKERRAEMLASQIMGQSSSNPHIQEERGQKLEDSGLGEEDR